MSLRNWISGLMLAALIVSPAVGASVDWTGYINDKSLNGEPYGYLSSVSSTRPLSKLRLLCHSEEVFTLYLDENIIADGAHTVDIRVDSLPVVTLDVNQIDGRYEISNEHFEFWNLIAQMAAGAMIRIDAGKGLHQYNLAGFTNTFLQYCGWSDKAQNYRTYLHQYR